jgi:biotin carboxyl carrier protein
MKLQADIAGVVTDVEITRSGRECRAVVDGREYILDVSQPEPGVYLIKDGSTVSEATVTQTSQGGSNVHLRGREHQIAIIDPKRLRTGGGAHGVASGKAEIKTAMPGKVVRIIAAVGDTVQKGDGVIVVEAMKMQNEMKSPKDGTIVEIKAAEGDTVGAGDVLVVIE